MPVSTKDVLNAGLRAVLAAGEHHWVGKAIGTFVSEVAGAWKELPDEQRVALSEAGESELIEAFEGAGLASQRSGLSAVGPQAVEEMALALRGEVGIHLAGFESHVAERVAGVLRTLEPRFVALSEALKGAAGLERQVLDLRQEIVGHLIPLEPWQDFYWKKMRGGVPLTHLIDALGDEGFARLRQGFVGRNRELAHFQELLDRPDGPRVLYHSGNPGCGKSRLAIQYAHFARSSGWPVFFVSGRTEVMLSAWLREFRAETGLDRLLLIWDDWQGDREQMLRDFLAFEDDPLLGDLDVRRVLTTWPSFRSAVREASGRGVGMVEEPLPPLGDQERGEAAVVDFLTAVLPTKHRPEPGALKRVVHLAEGYPMALLLGVDLLIAGESVDALAGPEGIIGRSYARLIETIHRDLGAETTDAYVRLAMIGDAKLQDLETERVDEALPGFAKLRQELCQEGFVTFEEGTYRVEPDLLRRFVAERSLLGQPGEPLWRENPVAAWVEAARPFLPRWTAEIWSITNLALGDAAEQTDVKRGLLQGIDLAIKTRLPKAIESRCRWAFGIGTAGLAESKSTIGVELAERIATIARQSETVDQELDLMWAKALHNATVDSSTLEERLGIASRLESVASRHEPPNQAIDLEWAKALFNATENASTSDCLEIASRLESVSSRHEPPDREIDQSWAKALYNGAFAASTLEERLSISSRLELVAARHNPVDREIDLWWAKALCNTAVVGDDPVQIESLAVRIRSLADRHAVASAEFLEQELATTLCWWLATEDEAQRRELADARILPLTIALADHPERLGKVRSWWQRETGSLTPLPDPGE